MIVVVSSGERYKLRSGQNRIGRGDDCDLQIQSGDVSRHHAVIAWEPVGAHVMDLGSTNGSFLNGEKLTAYEYQPIKAGDQLDLGSGDQMVRLAIEDEPHDQPVEANATVIMQARDLKQAEQKPLTPEMVAEAYEALASGEMSRIRQYWDEGVSWWIPGSGPLAGWHRGLEAFIAYLRRAAALSGSSLRSVTQAVMVGGDQTAVLSQVTGFRAGYNESSISKPHTRLEVELVQVLRWRDGKIVEGRTAIFGEGMAEYDQFWSSMPEQV